jgi:hypothetical protein
MKMRPNEKAMELILKVGKFIWQEKEVAVGQLQTHFNDQRVVALAKYLAKQGDFIFDGQTFYAKPLVRSHQAGASTF